MSNTYKNIFNKSIIIVYKYIEILKNVLNQLKFCILVNNFDESYKKITKYMAYISIKPLIFVELINNR